MADRRRRRRARSSELEESENELSDVSDDDPGIRKESELESDLERAGVESEYESAEEEEVSESEKKRKTKNPDSELNLKTVDKSIDKSDEEKDVIDGEGEDEYVEDEEEEGDEDDEDEDDECIEGERQEGDGEESVSPIPVQEVVLDDDEDRRNPQYIPKKGSFYEHDDRLSAEPEEEVKEKKGVDKKKKKLWLDEGRWNHDMFREEEQSPKSRDELVSIYGYDIRCEDGPPRARRRRRYGHGPMKYTRNWQDEDAYSRLRGQGRGFIRGRGRGFDRGRGFERGRGYGRGRGGSRRGQYFRNFHLNGEDSHFDNKADVQDDDDDDRQNDSRKTENFSNGSHVEPVINKDEFPALPSKELPSNSQLHEEEDDEVVVVKERTVSDDTKIDLTVAEIKPAENQIEVVRTQTFENSRLSQKVNRSETVSSRPARSRGGGYGRTSTRHHHKFPSNITKTPGESRHRFSSGSQPRHQRNIVPRQEPNLEDKVVSEFDKLSINNNKQQTASPDNKIPNPDSKAAKSEGKWDNTKPSTPSNSQETQNTSRSGENSSSRPKRYSSLRQRSLPETTSYKPTQPTLPPQYYNASPSYQPTLYVTSEAIPASNQQTGSPPLITPASYPGYTAPSYPENYGMRPPIPSPTRIFPTATLPAPQPVIPSSYIAPNGGIVNYAPPPPPPAGYPQFPFPQFTSPPPPVVPPVVPPPAVVPPPPVSQPQEIYRGGITYYNTHSQQHASRVLPQKRPKAAIPIVPPPEPQSKKSEKQVDMTKTLSEESRESCECQSPEEEDTSENTSIPTQPTVEVES